MGLLERLSRGQRSQTAMRTETFSTRRRNWRAERHSGCREENSFYTETSRPRSEGIRAVYNVGSNRLERKIGEESRSSALATASQMFVVAHYQE